MNRPEFLALLDRAAAGWATGDAAAVADCFAADVDYSDPTATASGRVATSFGFSVRVAAAS